MFLHQSITFSEIFQYVCNALSGVFSVNLPRLKYGSLVSEHLQFISASGGEGVTESQQVPQVSESKKLHFFRLKGVKKKDSSLSTNTRSVNMLSIAARGDFQRGSVLSQPKHARDLQLHILP